MFGNRHRHIFLTTAFLVLICSNGLIQIVVDLREGRAPQATELFVRTPTHANIRAFETDLQDNCWLTQKLRPYVQYAQFMILRELGDKAIVGEDNWLFYKPAVQYLVEPWALDEAGEQGNVISAVVSFKDELAQRGIHLLVVPAPNKSSVYPDMLTKQAGKGEAHAAPAGEAMKYYLIQDSHWSPEGVRLAAQAVARRLTDLGWAEKRQTNYTLKPVTIERCGDILKMTQVPQIERQFEPERIHCTQVVSRETNQPYHSDPNSEVLVLGDSFLRIYSQDEPGGAGFVEHLGYELGFPMAAIVNDGGASTLVRQQLSRNPKLLADKKVVVWEFVERDIRFGTEGWQIVHLP
jgi:hypothetical protein